MKPRGLLSGRNDLEERGRLARQRRDEPGARGDALAPEMLGEACLEQDSLIALRAWSLPPPLSATIVYTGASRDGVIFG